MAEVCEACGADVTVLADAIGRDPRIGRSFLSAGIGFGGGCLPKDIRAFQTRADELGVGRALAFLDEVDAINERRRLRVVDLVHDHIGASLIGKKICVLGASFKPGSDDIRDSPALDIAERLEAAGADVHVCDPEALPRVAESSPRLVVESDPTEALVGAEAVLLLTDWKHFIALDPRWAGDLVARRVIIDGRNALPAERWMDAGWTYIGLGRGAGLAEAPETASA